MKAERELELERHKSIPIAPQKTADGLILVDWYTTDDPANPQNWSQFKKAFVIFVLCAYTTTIYCAGPIYSHAEDGIVQHFRVSPVAASPGLALYGLLRGTEHLANLASYISITTYTV